MRSSRRTRYSHRGLIVVAVAAAAALPPTAAASTMSAVPGWYFGDAPIASGSVELTAATAPLASEVWVVGNALSGEEATSSAFVARFNGTFQTVPSAPVTLGADVRLHDVASTPDDIWAVGNVRSDSGVAPRIERYRQKPAGSRGEAMPFQTPGQSAELRSVAMISSTDGWAVGYADPGAGQPTRTLIARWNGTTWTEIPSPSPGKLNSVAAKTAKDVWAVGHTQAPGSTGPAQTLVLHWDGVTWKTIPSPGTGPEDTTLLGVAIAASNDVWAAGYTGAPTGPSRAIAMHWNGSTWKLLPSRPDMPTRFTDVSATSSTKVWFAAYTLTMNRETAHIEHWDGQALRVSPIYPPPGPGPQHVASALNGITAGHPDSKPVAVGWLIAGTTPTRLPALLQYA